jgi:hypothetical protein
MTINDISLQDIYDFMERGNPENAPEHIVAYLNLLDAARGMMLRIDKFSNDEMIIKHFIMVVGLSRYKARQIIDEAREYFYCDSKVSKAAWRNIYGEKAEKVLNFAMLNMKDAKDAIAVIKAIKELIDIRGVNEPDKDELPDELFQKQIVVYTTDTRQLGLPYMDRNRIKELIDKKIPGLNEKEREMIYREADILPFKAFLDESENARKV